jgi:hypothetical protein
MTPAANVKIEVRIGHPQIVEKDSAHGFVIMLSGVDQIGIEFSVLG